MPSTVRPKVLSWASDVEENTLDQAEKSAQLPFIEGHVALMADAHLGYGATVGSVIPTRGAIIPAAVGVDIGCGMAAIQLGITAEKLPDTLDPLLSKIGEVVPAGVGQGHEDFSTAKIIHKLGSPDTHLSDKQANTVLRQMGTLGAGNHFIEVCLDADERVWIVLHSGSRGIGNQIAMSHIKKAKGMMKQYFIDVPDPDLAYFVEHTPEFDDYWEDLTWAQEYARLNRVTMMNNILAEFQEFIGYMVDIEMEVNCHHNYTALENHKGRNLYITRKGAISAKAGEMGIIPGSMGTNSFIVSGLGNEASYTSAPHGAGRRMSRTRAKKEFDTESLDRLMEGKAWNADHSKALLDEHPRSYKDVHQVMEDSADMVEITHELTQVLNFKGA